MRGYRQLFFWALACAAGCLANQEPDTLRGASGTMGADQGDSPTSPAAGEASDPDASQVPFTPVPAASYVNKVKTLLTGLPASANEIAQGADDVGLGALLDTWMAEPAFDGVLLNFFALAFQQGGLTYTGIRPQYDFGNHGSDQAAMWAASFPRTALYFVRNKRPFNSLASTNEFMVTPQLLLDYTIIDLLIEPDNGGLDDVLKATQPNFTFTLTPTGGATSMEDLIDPQSPNYMRIAWPVLAKPLTSDQCGCNPTTCGLTGGPVTWTTKNSFEAISPRLVSAIMGAGFNYYQGDICTVPSVSTVLTLPTDKTAWRLVTIKTPQDGGQPLNAWDLPKMRKDDVVTLRIPRVGFFTTPAFLGQWQTNINNQARVTVNQTLIAGLNRAFDGSDRTMPSDLRAIPVEHAAPASSCYGCHLTMDPMRQYFRQALTVSYHTQNDANQKSLPGVFAQGGRVASAGGLQQLGEQIASSPLFATAWTMKVCMWLNSAPCTATDPEIIRISNDFAATNFDFLAMFKSVAMSPLTTYKSTTLTAQRRGAVTSMARRDQLCQNLSARLGVNDICNLAGNQGVGNFVNAGGILTAYPADGYSRATPVWAQSTTPNMMMRTGLENACGYIAQQVVDNGAGSQFLSSNPNAAIQSLMTNFLGVDPNVSPQVQAIFIGHYQAAIKGGASASTAMRSTFVLACLSPYIAHIGI